jgi:hypothetical protein
MGDIEHSAPMRAADVEREWPFPDYQAVQLPARSGFHCICWQRGGLRIDTLR